MDCLDRRIMKVSLKWLSDYVEVPSDIKAFCDKLDLTGTGVEGVDKLAPRLTAWSWAMSEMRKTTLIPTMHVVKVNVGWRRADSDGVGAPNIAAGIKVPVATIGAVLPGDFKIKKSKLRGVTSMGMCCSKRELGMGTDHEGIWVLPEDAQIGQPIADFMGLADTVLDLEITPNRPDSLSVVGFAREVGAMYAKPWTNPLQDMAAKLELAGEVEPNAVKIDVADAVRCPRYSARVIHGVKVGPSPDWMVERLAAIGQRSVNNVVDVTNYILFLFGQPRWACV